jgi:hypothetical protein
MKTIVSDLVGKMIWHEANWSSRFKQTFCDLYKQVSPRHNRPRASTTSNSPLSPASSNDTVHHFLAPKPTNNVCFRPPATCHIYTATDSSSARTFLPANPILTIEDLHLRFHNKPSPFHLENKTSQRSIKRTRNKTASVTQSLSRFLASALPAFSRFLTEMQPKSDTSYPSHPQFHYSRAMRAAQQWKRQLATIGRDEALSSCQKVDQSICTYPDI